VARKVVYWVSTGVLSALSLFAAFAYLSGNSEAVQGFARVGYPQQLRIMLGIAKPLGAIALLVPGWPRLKEWAYAGSHSRGFRRSWRIMLRKKQFQKQ
jgi:hypothetical protein